MMRSAVFICLMSVCLTATISSANQPSELEQLDTIFSNNYTKCLQAKKYDTALEASDEMLAAMMKIVDRLEKNFSENDVNKIKDQKKYPLKFSQCAQVRIKLYGPQ
jgi:hypothetical protein